MSIAGRPFPVSPPPSSAPQPPAVRRRFSAVWLTVAVAVATLAVVGAVVGVATAPTDSAQGPSAELAPSSPETVAETPQTEAAGADEPVSPENILAASAPMDAPPSEAGPPAESVVAVKKGDTLIGILEREGVEAADARAAISALSEVGKPDRLHVGQEILLKLRRDGETVELLELSMIAGPSLRMSATRDEDGAYSAVTAEQAVSRKPTLARLRVRTSLYDAATAAGLPATVLDGVIRAYAHEVDFQRELRPGDTLEVLYERALAEDGRAVRSGAAVWATLRLGKRAITLVRRPTGNGRAEYVSPDGRQVRSALLRTPLDAVRISSGYGMRRHPILGYSRMHRGVDFAAAAGTPVYAAGDGTVAQAERQGSYGNYIRLRHDQTWNTAYAHLSRFARGVKPGARVRQGQVIGYVGSTGRSTGPHLHFELLKAGEAINPKTTAVIRPDNQDREKREDFHRYVRDLETRVAALRESGER